MMRQYLSAIFVVISLLLPQISAQAADTLFSSLQADFILVEKGARRLTLYSGDTALRTYDISLGTKPSGPKVRKGDRRTPEGVYYIDGRNPWSRYHRSLHISYPDKDDIEKARKLGKHPGGNIMIHGTGKKYARVHKDYDWTTGCIAVTDNEIDEIWAMVPEGAKIEIRP